jgi:hypothetical protein
MVCNVSRQVVLLAGLISFAVWPTCLADTVGAERWSAAFLHGAEALYRCDELNLFPGGLSFHYTQRVPNADSRPLALLPEGTPPAACFALCRENERPGGCLHVVFAGRQCLLWAGAPPRLPLSESFVRDHFGAHAGPKLPHSLAPSPLRLCSRARKHGAAAPSGRPRGKSAASTVHVVLEQSGRAPSDINVVASDIVAHSSALSRTEPNDLVVMVCGVERAQQLVAAVSQAGFQGLPINDTEAVYDSLGLPTARFIEIAVRRGAVLRRLASGYNSDLYVVVDALLPSSLGRCNETGWTLLAAVHRVLEIYGRGRQYYGPHGFSTAFDVQPGDSVYRGGAMPPTHFTVATVAKCDTVRAELYSRLRRAISGVDPRLSAWGGTKLGESPAFSALGGDQGAVNGSRGLRYAELRGPPDALYFTSAAVAAIDGAARHPIGFGRCRYVAYDDVRLACAASHAIDGALPDGYIGLPPSLV